MANPTILIPDMCNNHQVELIRGAGYTSADPWRALIVASQIALFQAATIDPETHKKIQGEITLIGTLGCLACYKPAAFAEIIEAGKSHELGRIKALGEKWVADAAKPEQE